jgi:hypothetical protein
MCSRAPAKTTTCLARGATIPTHFVRGNSGHDGIYDSGGKDKLDLSNYSRSELKVEPDDLNNNGEPDSLLLRLGKSWQNTVVIEGFYDDKKSTPAFDRSPGYIEVILVK